MAVQTKPSGDSVEKFLSSVDDPRRAEDARTAVELMRRVTGQEPTMWGPSMIGFGSFHYRYASGHEGDTFVVGLSPRKAALTVYGVYDANRPDPRFEALGPHTTGKGCLYVKDLAKLDADVFEQLVADAWQRHLAAQQAE